MNLQELIAESISKGISIQEKSKGTSKVRNEGPPKPSTWEYLIDTLSLVPKGTFLPLDRIILIMHERGWSTKAGTPTLQYRTVHSSTYKACKNDAKGTILPASCIDRSKSKDTLYALHEDTDDTLIEKMHAWIEGKEWEGTDESQGTDTSTEGTDESE